MKRAAILAAAWIFHCAHAAPPAVQSLFPMGGQRGTEVWAQITGTLDPWPMKGWADHPGIQFAPDEKKKGFFKIQLAPDTPPGPHLVRFHNANGSTPPRVFFVGTAPDVPELEPNDAFVSPQTVTNLPAIVHGKLEKNGDVDSYGLRLKAGQTLVAAVDAFNAGSPMDALLTLRDESGSRVAFHHDTHTLDPRLAWACPRDGVYVLQVAAFAYPASSGVNFAGSAAHVYRLTLTQGPYVTHSLPMGVTRGKPSRVELRGWNVAANTFVDLPAGNGETVLLPGTAVNAPLRIHAGAAAEWVEAEPNDTTNQVQILTLPAAVTGCISRAGDVDRVAFHATRGQSLLLDLQSSRSGFLLDGKLAVEDAAGKILASNDDGAGHKDPQLNWSAPADGSYFAVITDLFGQGGPEHVYRLSIAVPAPDFSGSVTTPNFILEQGRTNEVKVTVRMTGGFNGKLRLSATGLPNGVSAAPVEVTKAGESVLKIIATAIAAPAGGEIRIVLQEVDRDPSRPVVCELTTAGTDNGVPQGFPDLIIRQTEHLWLSLVPPAPATVPPAKAP